MEKQNQYQFLLNNINTDVTVVENIFITEYMPSAQAAYVKVYLYGLMAARNPNAIPVSNESMAELFNMTVGDVINAWQYWKDQGILDVKISGRNLSSITFYNIAECLINGKPSHRKKNESAHYDHDLENMFDRIQNMYGSRPLSKADMRAFTEMMEDYRFSPEVIILLVEYSLNMLNKKDQGYNDSSARNYMKTVAKSWYEADVQTFEDAEVLLNESRERSKYHYDILRKLGIHRGVSEFERTTMDSWLKDWHFSRDMIDYAVSTATTPNIKYINAILKKWHEKGWEKPSDVKKTTGKKFAKGAVRDQDVQHLSEEDRKLYQQRAQEDEDWFNSIEENSDESK